VTVPESSIVIRTFNEEKHLPRLLEGLSQQSYRDFEIVVVDSGSLDRTRDIAAASANKLLRIDSHDFTFGYSLNVGIQAAAGQFSVLVSAHTVPSDDRWLSKLVEPLHDASTAMSYGRQLGWPSSKYSEIQDLGRTFGRHRRVQKPPNFFVHNANSAIRKELWEQHPFDETLPGLEDMAWAKYWMERGYQVVYEPEAALHHIHEESWRQIRRRYYREALAARWIGVKSRRHVVTESVRDLGYTFLDLGKAIVPFFSRSEQNKGTLELGRQVLLFRAHKTAGTVRGLLDGAVMRDSAGRESVFFDRSSKSVVIRGPGRASLEELEIPEVKPGDVLIRTVYSGICGIDLEIFEGTSGYFRDKTAKYPIVPGRELSGRLVTTGPNVSHLKEGDAVVVESFQGCGTCPECRTSNWIGCPDRSEMGVTGRNGGYAQYLVVPGRFVHQVPPGLDLQAAALCQPLATILKGLHRLARYWPATPDTKRCAVVGAGSLGHFCARVLAHWGHTVTAFDRDPERRSYFQGSRIQVSEDLSNLAEFDVLVELTGDPETLDTMLDRSAPGATILLLGLPYAHRQFTFESIAAYDKTVVGSVGGGAHNYEEALHLLQELDLDAYLRCIMPLEQFREGWRLSRERKHLKVLLQVGEDLS
jgi:2-desacetyl-2-hydroxyethyl bacteriochlorophyllide A dehydrogenase